MQLGISWRVRSWLRMNAGGMPYTCKSGLGWTFDSAETNKLIHALGNCLLTFRQYKQSWEGLQRRGMTQDLSWDNAAQQYEEVLVAAKYQW